MHQQSLFPSLLGCHLSLADAFFINPFTVAIASSFSELSGFWAEKFLSYVVFIDLSLFLCHSFPTSHFTSLGGPIYLLQSTLSLITHKIGLCSSIQHYFLLYVWFSNLEENYLTKVVSLFPLILWWKRKRARKLSYFTMMSNSFIYIKIKWISHLSLLSSKLHQFQESSMITIHLSAGPRNYVIW